MACRFELDLLQDPILRSPSELQNEICNKRFLHPAHLVYNANQARAPFREFFKRVFQKSINEEGLEDENYVNIPSTRLWLVEARSLSMLLKR
jgi:hypothetical protein